MMIHQWTGDHRRWTRYVGLVASLLLFGCGGGSGGPGGTTSSSASLATISFVASASAVYVGQTVTLQWVSTNASTCSSNWSGNTVTQGSQQVSVTADATYSLNCGDAAASVQVRILGKAAPASTNSVAWSASGLTSLQYMSLPITGDPTYDAFSGLLYVITGTSSATYPNSLLAIQPTTGQVVAARTLDALPWKVMVSADGQYLYVLYYARNAPVHRFTTVGLALDLTLTMPADQNAVALDISPLSAKTIALTTVGVEAANYGNGYIRILDDDAPRPNSYEGELPENFIDIKWSEDGKRIFAPGSLEGTKIFSVNTQGLTLSKTVLVHPPTGGRLYGSRYYTDSGQVYDFDSPISEVGAMATSYQGIIYKRDEDLSIGKAYGLSNDIYGQVFLVALSATTHEVIDTLWIPRDSSEPPGGGGPVTWGVDGLAWGQGDRLIIAHGSFAQAGGEVTPPSALPPIGAGKLVSSSGVAVTYSIYNAAANDIAADTCGNLYAATSGYEDYYSYSVLKLDPQSASVLAVSPKLPRPNFLAVADDCSTIYAASSTSNRITRLNLPSLTLSYTIPVTSDSSTGYSASFLPFASSLAVAPGHPDTLAVGMSFHTSVCDGSHYGISIFDGQARRSVVYESYNVDDFIAITWGMDANTLYGGGWFNNVAFTVDASGVHSPTPLFPYSGKSLVIYGIERELYFDRSRARLMDVMGAVYDTRSNLSLGTLPVVTAAANACDLVGAIATDSMSGKIFHAGLNSGGLEAGLPIVIRSFDASTLKEIDSVTIPDPRPLLSWVGALRLVRLAGTNGVALVTDGGQIIVLNGPMFAP